jgi:uncharacterized protein YdcH (DUF465 family)
MSLDQNEIKKLLEGVELEEGAVAGIAAMVDKSINEKVEAAKAESVAKEAALNEENDALKAQIATLMEKADEYGKKMADEARAEVSTLAEEYGKYVQQETAERLNDYAKYATAEFIKEQKDNFVQLDEYNRMKHVFETVKSSFELNGFPVNDEVALTEARKDVETSKAAFNSLFEKHEELTKELETAQQKIIFSEMTTGLSDVQKERLVGLSENVKVDGVEQFRSALKFMVETVTKTPTTAAAKPAAQKLDESRDAIDPKTPSSLIENTLKFL